MEKGLKIKLLVGAVLVCVLVAVLALSLKKKYTPSETMGSLEGYYDIAKEEAVIILENDRYEENAILMEGGVYLSYDMVTRLLKTDFYLDKEENILSYALPEELIRVEVGKAVYHRNEEVCNLNSPALLMLEDGYHMSLEFVSMFADMQYTFYENPNRLIIQNRWVEFLYYDTVAEAPVRFEPDIKSDIIRYVPAGEKLYYIGGSGKSGGSFLKVMMADGIYGYVQRKFLSESYYDARQSSYEEPVYEYTHMEEKVRLGWHVVTVPQANNNLEKVVAKAESMNVISPTWYELSDNEGNFDSLADSSYVERAHEMGLQVWALISNFPMGEDKGYNISTYEIFSSTKARTALIDNMMEEAKEIGFDGWNIDFEGMLSQTGPHFNQFLKELAIRCREEGLILSVDNVVSALDNPLFDLKTQGQVVDYVIIMAYDEHTAKSAVAGSVASMGFLQEAVNDSLAKIPADNIIMGVPFYTRIWGEETVAGTTSVIYTEALTMNGGKDILERNKVTAKWDADCGQNYAEYTLDGVTYKIWLEDVDSMTERLKIIGGAGLAGVAAWRLGFETEEIWPVIGNYIK
ncbi:MAG: hypothetical protein E7260_04050 [Lachnospiraceae bacterium]|nr:hypothetical protein [Lachnospiraceae bacterium]